MKERACSLLRMFAEAPGAPGDEGGVRRLVRQLFPHATTDRTGNIVAEFAGESATPRVVLAAHMDEVAFAVQSIAGDGLIRFVTLGGWWAHTLLSQRVNILTRSGDRIVGVIGSKPPHLLSSGEREKVLPIESLFIDVGAENAADVRERFGIALGDRIVPESPFTPMYNPDYLLCKAFDDRAGVALGVQACERLRDLAHPNTVCFLGTVQEEVGVRGAKTACADSGADVAIVLEGTPADDFPGISADDRQGVPGKGVQIRLMDPSAIMNRKLVDLAAATADDCGIRTQLAVRRSGGTDARELQAKGSGVPTVVLGVPARYIHSHNSIIHIDDYLAGLELAVHLAVRLDAPTVHGLTQFDD